MYEVCREYEITVRYIRFRLPPKFPEDIIYSSHGTVEGDGSTY